MTRHGWPEIFSMRRQHRGSERPGINDLPQMLF